MSRVPYWAGGPLIWRSKKQSHIPLNTSEAEEGACHPHDTITIVAKVSAVNLSARLSSSESRAASATILKITHFAKNRSTVP